MGQRRFLNLLTDPHPTAEEWAARQERMPAGMRAVLHARAALKAAQDREATLRDEADRRASEQHRSEFEAAVASVLVSSGAEWLVAYRVPDHECAGLPLWDRHLTEFLAHFDPVRVGCWPMRLTLRTYPASVGCGWFESAQPWCVYRPRGPVSSSSFAAALEVAAEYCPTPF